MKDIILLGLAATAMFACSPKNGEGEVHALTLQGDTIVVSDVSPLKAKLKVTKIEKTPFQMKFTTSGEVKAIPTRYADIASPFAGRITKSFVRLGQKVVQGSPVFEISSPDFFETGKVYYQAKQEMELALKSLNREKDLVQNRVGVEKEMEEAEVNYELKKKDYENAVAALKVYQINPDELVLGQPLVVRSPIAGEVVKNDIIIGQYMKEDADPVAVIADLSHVWVVAHVKEKDIPLVRQLADVEVQLIAVPDKVIEGRIYHISEMLDETTRAVEVLIECDNTDRSMKPAMYGNVQLSDKAVPTILIPTSAILQEEESSFVVRALGNNRYRKQAITTCLTEGNHTVVTSGLQEGDEIVTEGAFYLLEAR